MRCGFACAACIVWLGVLVASCGERDAGLQHPPKETRVFSSRASDYELLLRHAFVEELEPMFENAAPEVALALRMAATTAASNWAQQLVQRLVLGPEGTCTWTFAESLRPAYNSGSYMAELPVQLVSRVYRGTFSRGADSRIVCVFHSLEEGVLASPLEVTFAEEAVGELAAPSSMRDLPMPLAEPPLRLTVAR